ncbi:histidinol-phosphate aminotransferase [Coniochaeta ligniaria NRRL 30616]|uniref:histidinol-phosphate transaminase n=1 Tax=Coniochaeta ligniaria NRRL 30616 TaxID=1408157 RepID=A0A1J7IHS7_9PEZI|nr:histidinol-phosphate aminotransferase [Coniochaeta ligniaria NRRL 30616]
MATKSPFNLSRCARPNILALQPYTSTRDDYANDDGVILLDANENNFGPCVPIAKDASSDAAAANTAHGITVQSALDPAALQLHRYPDAHQIPLRQAFCDLRNTCKDTAARPLTPDNVCLGVGSDESIDGIIRAFCTPGKDKILVCPPTYAMYQVSSDVNDVGVVKVDLDAEKGFALRPDAIAEALSGDASIKVVFICSPANPTGNLIPHADIKKVLQHPTWNGVVVVDEAYIDFAPTTSLVEEVNMWPNLIVTHTMSKAFGLAAVRLGLTYSPHPISQLLNNLRGPYNMSAPTVALAAAALQPEARARQEENQAKMAEQRDRLIRELPKIPGVGKFLGGFSTNFILVQFLSKPADEGGVPDNAIATAVMHDLATESKVLVRYRGTQVGCLGSLRISVGTEQEVTKVLARIRKTLKDGYGLKTKQ